MFEDYVPKDREFINEVLKPAFEFLVEKFGYKPLICKLVPDEIRKEHKYDWLSYPSAFYKITKDITLSKKEDMDIW